MKQLLHGTAVGFYLLCAPAILKADTVDFQSLERSGIAWNHISSYTEDGYLFTSDDSPGDALTYFHSDHPYWPGSTALFNKFDGKNVILTTTSGQAFNINSIELTEYQPFIQPATVVFTGTKADASTVQTSFTLDGIFGLETFRFSTEFTNLVELEWHQGTLRKHQFDNLELTTIPAPSTIVGLTGLLAMGVIGYGWRRLRTRGSRVDSETQSPISTRCR